MPGVSMPQEASFQLTRPRGARRELDPDAVFYVAFQLTRPRGARPERIAKALADAPFQLTRPRGARPVGGVAVAVGVDVSTHAPARGATLVHDTICICILKFQLTRPRGARPAPAPTSCAICRVSTHAPARGATAAETLFRLTQDVSTHAPARGATAPRELHPGTGEVSTHAPARGATGLSRPRVIPSCCFNSRAREGRDSRTTPARTTSRAFQLTRPRGARRVSYALDEGMDLVSTHAPARGATAA